MKRHRHPHDRLVESLYTRHFCGVQIRLLDLPQVFAAGRTAASTTNGDLAAIHAAMAEAVARVRCN